MPRCHEGGLWGRELPSSSASNHAMQNVHAKTRRAQNTHAAKRKMSVMFFPSREFRRNKLPFCPFSFLFLFLCRACLFSFSKMPAHCLFPFCMQAKGTKSCRCVKHGTVKGQRQRVWCGGRACPSLPFRGRERGGFSFSSSPPPSSSSPPLLPPPSSREGGDLQIIACLACSVPPV